MINRLLSIITFAPYFLSVLLVVSAAGVNSYAESPGDQRELVRIGVIVPLTGGLANRGDDVTKLLSIVENHLAQLPLKYRYQFIIEDGKCGAGNTTTSATMKLINLDKVRFLITGCSGETLQAGPIAEKNKIILIAVLSLHQDIKNLGDYIFRTFVDIQKSFQGFADYMDSETGGKIAILTEENAFTFGIRNIFLEHLGQKVVFAEDFATDSADFRALLSKSKAKGARGIYLNAMSEGTLANMVNQAKRMGMDQRLFSYNMPQAASFRAATGKNSDNLYFIGDPELKNASQEFRNILDQYMQLHPQGPSYEFILRTTYDAVKSIVDAVEAVGNNTMKVKDFLYSYSTTGALGKVAYDSNGDIKNLHWVLRKVGEDGKVRFVRELVDAE